MIALGRGGMKYALPYGTFLALGAPASPRSSATASSTGTCGFY